MPIVIDGKIYYRTLEACKKTGISRATLFRWLKVGLLDKQLKDRRGWRIFTEANLDKIRAEAGKINVEYTFSGRGHEPAHMTNKKQPSGFKTANVIRPGARGKG